MIIFVDADNGAPKHSQGIEKLDKSDKVSYYYNCGNPYYSQESNRTKLLGRSKANIQFVKTINGKNSADFVIMLDADAELKKDSTTVIALISADSHFEVIVNILKQRHPGAVIKSFSSIDESYTMKLLEPLEYKQIRKIIERQYGIDVAERVMSQIESIVIAHNKDKDGKKRTNKNFFSKLKISWIERIADG